jgi:hypothetical protein
MSELRITSLETMVLEMLRVALGSELFPTDYPIASVMTKVELQVTSKSSLKGEEANAEGFVHVFGVPSRIKVQARLSRIGSRVWQPDSCTVQLETPATFHDSQQWKFKYSMNNGRINIDFMVRATTTAHSPS